MKRILAALVLTLICTAGHADQATPLSPPAPAPMTCWNPTYCAQSCNQPYIINPVQCNLYCCTHPPR